MTWLLKYDKLLVSLVLIICLVAYIFMYVWEETHLTANLTEIAGVIDLGDIRIYVERVR